jgi:DNA helicase-2/ATP-dependent DNA helicase PcrA
MRIIIPGPPGTGKTHHLINHYLTKELVEHKTIPERIAFISFSNAAADTARQRAEELFPGKDFKYFTTMHSLGARELKINTKEKLLQGSKWNSFKNFSVVCKNMSFETYLGDSGIPQYEDNHMKIINYARSKKLTILDAAVELDLHQYVDIWLTEQIDQDLKSYKEQTKMIEFSDMIDEFIEKDKCPSLDAVFLDEAQDLSPSQWDMFFYIESRCERSYIAGDDDQTIYTFQGADPDIFINLKGTYDARVKSRRVPKKIYDVAVSILSQIETRLLKKWEPKEEEGNVYNNIFLEDIDFSKGKWFVLTRTNNELKPIAEHLESIHMRFDSKVNNLLSKKLLDAYRIWVRLNDGATVSSEEALKIYDYLNYNKKQVKRGYSQGQTLTKVEYVNLEDLVANHGLLVTGSWELLHIEEASKVYIKGLIEQGEDLFKDARIRLSTIHRAKGDEEDNVVLFTDLRKIIYEQAKKNPDPEHRLFFVGVTRAKHNLYIMAPTEEYYYTIGDPII